MNEIRRLRCEHCNAPRITQKKKQQASAWGMSATDTIPRGKPYYTVQDKMQELEDMVTECKKNIGLAFIEPFFRLVRKVANGLAG